MAGLKRAKYNTATDDYFKQLASIYKAAQWYSKHCKDKCSGDE
jgi:hypothetical protein